MENEFEKNGEHTVSEERISYSEDDRQFSNSRTTTFKPDGTQRILTYTSQETENNTLETNGMLTDGRGAKIYDFKDVNYKDKDRNLVLESTVYYPDKSVHHINEVFKTDDTKIREERTFDADGRNTYFQLINFDANEEETSSETSYYKYKDGQVIAEKLLIDAAEGRMLSFTEKNDEYGSTAIGDGKLLDLEKNELADYHTETTTNKDGSEYRVDTYVYPNGKVDLVSRTMDADGKINIRTQLDFKAAGENAEETSDDDSEYKNFYNLTRYQWESDDNEPDDELIGYFEEINDVWGEKFDGDTEELTEEFNDVLEDLHEEFINESEAVTDNNSDSDAWNGDDGGSDSWGGDDGGSDSWDGDDGGSDSWD